MRVLPFLLCLAGTWTAGCAWAAMAEKADTLSDRISQIRLLAEHDAPAALREVQGLQAIVPDDAPPAERVRLLNLLSRIEIYLLMQPEHAEWHAQQALDLAMQHGDRVGQGEADINLALIAISQGKLARQDERISHALPLLEDSHRPDLLAEAMAMASMMYRRNGLVSEAGDMAMHALERAQRSGDPVALAYAYQGLAQVYDMSDRDAETGGYFERMRKQAHAVGQYRMEALALTGLARISTRLGNLQEADRLVRMAIDIDRRAGVPAALGNGLIALADNLQRQGRLRDAVKAMDEAVGIFETHMHKSGLWWALYTRSAILEAAGRDGRADAERIMRLAQELGLPLYRHKSARRLADIAVSRGEWQRAYEYTARAAETLEQGANNESGLQISKVARQFEADRQQRRIDELARKNEHRQRWVMTGFGAVGIVLAGLLAFLAYQRKSNRRLQALNRQLQQSRDELRDSEQRLSHVAVHIPGFIHTYRMEPSGHFSMPFASMGICDVLGLEPEDVRDDAMPMHRRTHQADVSKIADAIAESAANLANFHVEVRVLHEAKGERWVEIRSTPERLPDGSIEWHGIMLDITERKHMELQLQESQLQLRALAERNETIREAERRHLAREVHDELGQMLNAVRLNLLSLDYTYCRDNPGMQDMVRIMLTNLNQTIVMVRNIVAALYPTVLEAGIAIALDWLVQEFGSNTGMTCDLLVGDDVVLDEVQTAAVYRIVQEALTNVARHSGAQRVDISLVRDDDMYRLDIIDDGVGFDVAPPVNHKSLGLIAMQERALMLGGIARLDGKTGQGATLRFDFPLQRGINDDNL